MLDLAELIQNSLKYEKGYPIKINWKGFSIKLKFLPLEFLLPNGSPGVYYTPNNLIATYKGYCFYVYPEKKLSHIIFAHELGHALFYSLMTPENESLLYRYWIFSPVQEFIAWVLGLSWVADVRKVSFALLKNEYKEFIIFCLDRFGKNFSQYAYEKLSYLHINDVVNSLKNFDELANVFNGK
jgi:hypothetical protein